MHWLLLFNDSKVDIFHLHACSGDFSKDKNAYVFLKKKHPQEKNMSMFFEGKKSLEKYDPPKKIQDNPVIQVTVAAVFFFLTAVEVKWMQRMF